MMCRISIGASMMLCFLVIAGCAGTPDRELLAEREAIRHRGLEFSEALRRKDINGALRVLDPYMSSGYRIELQRQIKTAMKLRLYAGYDPDWKSATDKLDGQGVKKGHASVVVGARNSDGLNFRDRYEFVTREGEWFLSALELQEPMQGDELDLSEAEEEEVRRVLTEVFERLKEGETGWFVSRHRKKSYGLYRYGKRSFLGKIFGIGPPRYSIYEDLERLDELVIAEWPDLEDGLPLAYIGPGGLVACYDVPYSWPGGGIYGDTLRIEVFLSLRDGEWSYEMTRFHGEAIPE